MSLPTILNLTLIGSHLMRTVIVSIIEAKREHQAKLKKAQKNITKIYQDQQTEEKQQFQQQKQQQQQQQQQQQLQSSLVQTHYLSDLGIENNQSTLQGVFVGNCELEKSLIAQQQHFDNKILNLYLIMSLNALIESIIARIYVKLTELSIDFPILLLFSLINSICVLLIHNSLILVLFQIVQKYSQKYKQSQYYLKIYLSFYNIFLTYLLYDGIENQVNLDFLTVLFAIIITSLIQKSIIQRILSKNEHILQL